MSKTDAISTIRTAINEDNLSVEIIEIPGRTKVGLRADEDSPYYAAFEGDRADEVQAFLDTYTDAIKRLYELHDADDRDSLEWCWECGAVLGDTLGDYKPACKKDLIKPVSNYHDDFSTWKIFQTEKIYKAFPEKDALPDIDLGGSPSYLAMMCTAADDAAEVRSVFDRVDYDEIKGIEVKTWRNVREMDALTAEAVAQAANDNGRDDWGKETMERRAEAVKTVYRMCGEDAPTDDEIDAALDATRGE